jgi:LuxR family maltose regulon positive regulatory protein
VEYLADNVLAMQPGDVQEFLLRTSLLTRLNARLCDAVTGRPDSESILSWLERSGLFVRSLDLHQQWFEYHALFASILSEEQYRRSESVALEVHGVAAKWHKKTATMTKRFTTPSPAAISLWRSTLSTNGLHDWWRTPFS